MIPPPMIWAQKSDLIYLTVTLEDVINPIVTFQEDSVYFQGKTKLNNRTYEVTVDLYEKINPEKCKIFNKERCIEIVLMKKDENQPYWPSLTPDKVKYHWLKVDFNKWNDEDEIYQETEGKNIKEIKLEDLNDDFIDDDDINDDFDDKNDNFDDFNDKNDNFDDVNDKNDDLKDKNDDFKDKNHEFNAKNDETNDLNNDNNEEKEKNQKIKNTEQILHIEAE